MSDVEILKTVGDIGLPPEDTREVGEFGRRLFLWRQHRGLTQKELAAKAGTHPYVITAVESGVAKGAQLNTLRKLAQALGITISQLVGA
jgi:transcriptional regulator with XRE-family HTH domain